MKTANGTSSKTNEVIHEQALSVICLAFYVQIHVCMHCAIIQLTWTLKKRGQA